MLSKSLEIKNDDRSVSLLPLRFMSFYKLSSLIISQCLPKSNVLACANFFQFTKKYQKNFWTKQTWIVTLITIFWTFHSPTTEIVRVSKGSKKKSFAIKVFYFRDSKLQQRFILKEEVSISEKKLNLYSTVWVNFSKLLIKPTTYRRFHYPNLNLRLDLQKQKTNCSVIVTRIYLSI